MATEVGFYCWRGGLPLPLFVARGESKPIRKGLFAR